MPIHSETWQHASQLQHCQACHHLGFCTCPWLEGWREMYISSFVLYHSQPPQTSDLNPKKLQTKLNSVGFTLRTTIASWLRHCTKNFIARTGSILSSLKSRDRKPMLMCSNFQGLRRKTTKRDYNQTVSRVLFAQKIPYVLRLCSMFGLT